jgi:quinol monooxygenase YgiN
MLVSIVTARVLAGKADIYERTFRELRQKVLANEPGISFYELCRVPGVPRTYKVIEACDTQATQDAHLATHYYQAAIEIIVGCLEDGSYEHLVCETI